MTDRTPVRSMLKTVGSLWFAAVLLLLLMVAMGSATVYESMRSTELAKAAFYEARWFRLLLVLLATNVAAAVAARYPFSRRLLPFLLAHVGILLILAGALVSRLFGIDGQLGLAKGETSSEFLVPGERLTLQATDGSRATVDLAPALRNRIAPSDASGVGELSVATLRAKAIRYLPDIDWERRVTNDSPQPRLGVDVALETPDHTDSEWLFPDADGDLCDHHASLREVSTVEQWNLFLGKTELASKGQISITVGDVTRQIPLEACEEKTAAIEGTPYTVRLKRYLPHAIVGPDRKSIVNASEKPLNPAVEVEVVGPEGADSRLAFAKFPDFHGRMGTPVIADLKVGFAASPALVPGAPIELLCGPEARLAVRFAQQGTDLTAQEVVLGEPVATPWPGETLTVRQRFDHARVAFVAVEQKPVRENRQPAVLVRVSEGDHSEEFWVQKHHERRFSAADQTYVLTYGDYALPLGFNVTLNQFRLGYYPGGERPRSFESIVRIADPATGHDRDAVVSMNRPVTYGGYTLYQSSYRRAGDDWATVLSVSRDRGRPIVFAGYSSLMLGMAWLLARRLKPTGPRAATVPAPEPLTAAAGGDVSP